MDLLSEKGFSVYRLFKRKRTSSVNSSRHSIWKKRSWRLQMKNSSVVFQNAGNHNWRVTISWKRRSLWSSYWFPFWFHIRIPCIEKKEAPFPVITGNNQEVQSMLLKLRISSLMKLQQDLEYVKTLLLENDYDRFHWLRDKKKSIWRSKWQQTDNCHR